jgi:hypothetical protein
MLCAARFLKRESTELLRIHVDMKEEVRYLQKVRAKMLANANKSKNQQRIKFEDTLA